MRYLLLTIFGILAFVHVDAQRLKKGKKETVVSPELIALQDSMRFVREQMLQEREDQVRERYNVRLESLMARALNQEGAFAFGFDSIPGIANLFSEDKKVRILNWNLPYNDQTHTYHGFIINLNEEGKYVVHQLTDKSAMLPKATNKQLDNNHWYGCLYYDIITKKSKSRTFYTLLGWDGNDGLTDKKVMDVLYFGAQGVPKFGAPVFKLPRRTQRRLFIEYGDGVVASMKYHEKKDQIVYDHMSPSRPELEGSYQFYGPDFTYDAMRWNGGKWEYVSDIQVKGDTSVQWNDPQE